MSVARRRGIGSQTRRRLTVLRVSLVVGGIDALTVGSWFVLVALEPRTTFTALSGLVVLIFGAVVRTGLVSFALSRSGIDRSTPQHVASGAVFAGAWVCWLLVAETIGSGPGMVVAGILFFGMLLVHFGLQWWTIVWHPEFRSNDPPRVSSLALSACLLVASATIMLAVVWYADLVLTAATIPIGSSSLRLEVPTVLAGISVLACCSGIGTLRLLSSNEEMIEQPA